MYLHFGNKKIIPVIETVGIFNTETLAMSAENKYFSAQLTGKEKTVVVSESNDIYTSSVSPFTVIKRTDILKESLWRSHNV